MQKTKDMGIEEIKMITELELQNLQKLEARLTPENRENAERYIRNCMEEPYASLLLGLFKREQENPLSRAFYIHVSMCQLTTLGLRPFCAKVNCCALGDGPGVSN